MKKLKEQIDGLERRMYVGNKSAQRCVVKHGAVLFDAEGVLLKETLELAQSIFGRGMSDLQAGEQRLTVAHTPRHNYFLENVQPEYIKEFSLTPDSSKAFKERVQEFLREALRQIEGRLGLVAEEYHSKKAQFGGLMNALKSWFKKDEARQKKTADLNLALEYADLAFLTGQFKEARGAYQYVVEMVKDSPDNEQGLAVSDAVAMQLLCLLQRRLQESLCSSENELVASLRDSVKYSGDTVNYNLIHAVLLTLLWIQRFEKFSRDEVNSAFDELTRKMLRKEAVTIMVTANILKEQQAVLYLRLRSPHIWRYCQVIYEVGKGLMQKLPHHGIRCLLASLQGFVAVPNVNLKIYVLLIKLLCKVYKDEQSVPYLREYMNQALLQLPPEKMNTVFDIYRKLIIHYTEKCRDLPLDVRWPNEMRAYPLLDY